MNAELIKLILVKNPQLKQQIEQGKFLTGYTKGGKSGTLISVFLCKSPWSDNCIKAKACGDIPCGDVFLVNNELRWSAYGNWKAYSPK